MAVPIAVELDVSGTAAFRKGLLRLSALAAVGVWMWGFAPTAQSATITSAPGGGLWSVSSTWVGGVVPGSGDAVIIVSSVRVNGSVACNQLTVQTAGLLDGQDGTSNSLTVAGSALVDGQVEDSTPAFRLVVGGDVVLGGSLAARELIVRGTGTHHLTMGPAATWNAGLTIDPGLPGTLVADTGLRLGGNINLATGALRLGPGSALQFLSGSFLGGTVEAQGNLIEGGAGAYFDGCTIDQAALEGIVQIGGAVGFTGGLTVFGTLRNTTQFGSIQTTIAGGLVNHGAITNNDYGMTIRLSGDLVNFGEIRNSSIDLDGVGIQTVSMGPDALFSAAILLPEFIPSTLSGLTDLRFSDQVSLGFGFGRLELGSRHTIRLEDHGVIFRGTVAADGCTIDFAPLARLDQVTVEGNVTLRGEATVQGATSFEADVEVFDLLRNAVGNVTTAEIDGTVTNHGMVLDSGVPLTLVVAGDLDNRGDWSNHAVILRGIDDQVVGVGSGLTTDELRLESGLGGSGHQWRRDGNPIPGANSPILVLSGAIGAASFGAYTCSNSGGATSRSITIAQNLGSAAVEPQPRGAPTVSLHPNPVIDEAEFRLTLPMSGPVRLSLHDVSGREMALLQAGILPAGGHVVTWARRELPAGAYYYRLDSAAGRAAGRLVLAR
ncbi:MAG: hypothetical protein IPK72_03975 [Candidatus Eisenbacteria bacterium]|nr:hypothetical protein [Candidatus Eisenbacteria bacterium]